MAEGKGVLIVGEMANGNLAAMTTELLGIGRKLADDLGEELSAVLMGGEVGGMAEEAIKFGADKVYVIESPLLKEYVTDSYVAAMAKLCEEIKPNILLMGQTSMGRDLAPRLAFRLGTGLTTDCLELSIDPDTKLMLQTKPVYGGNALSIVVCEETRPQMATIRPKSMDPLERNDSRKGEIVAYDAGLDESAIRVKFIEKVEEEVVGVKLEDADVVVVGGRGMGGPEPFAQLEELAKLLGGAVGASRPPCDSGWVPTTWQVGLTGKMVTPTLYIGVALSGASQHLAGCSGSKTMVAINKDPEANIFKVCQFGIVGDFKKVLPPFIDKVKELKKG
ncbi:MAG: electron transfer flavoprotein subunit alpha/FixB family protein [Dehalococcoidia bacterium]|nr:MAG: electron transfer flavoprotein subunit alpha/FixB family protein [Dehalococcoidia bacterium]